MYGLKSSKLTSGVWVFFAILRKSMSRSFTCILMKSFSKIVFGCLLLILSSGLQAQGDNGDGNCCDDDMSDFDPSFCAGLFSDINCVNDEPLDCFGTFDDPACIPLDGGLGLLAIAGGGLATAAMRRRREEELLEKEA